MPPRTSRKSKQAKAKASKPRQNAARKKKLRPKAKRSRELVLLDTGPIVGLYNESDNWHERCEEFFGQEDRYDYLLTHAVLCEAIFHIQKDRHAEAASEAVIDLLEKIENGQLKLHSVDEHDYVSRLKELREKYSDQKLDVADLSLVIAAEDRQIGKIVTIDRKDFGFLTYEKTGRVPRQSAFTVILPELEN